VLVKIGLIDNSKVFEVDVEDLEAFTAEMETARSATSFFWVTTSEGNRVGVPAEGIAYLDAGQPERRGAGF
jgi:hypothetical protein